MLSYQEQLSNATRSQMESMLELATSLASKAFEGVEKVVDLNMNTMRSSLEDSSAAVQQLLSAKDVQSFLALSASQAQPNAEKAMTYARQLAAITSGVQAEFAKATEAQFADANRKVVALVEEVSKNAPAGSENVVALMKSTLGNATASYEQLTKNTKQVVEAMEINIANAASQMSQAAKANSRSARK